MGFFVGVGTGVGVGVGSAVVVSEDSDVASVEGTVDSAVVTAVVVAFVVTGVVKVVTEELFLMKKDLILAPFLSQSIANPKTPIMPIKAIAAKIRFFEEVVSL